MTYRGEMVGGDGGMRDDRGRKQGEMAMGSKKESNTEDQGAGEGQEIIWSLYQQQMKQ